MSVEGPAVHDDATGIPVGRSLRQLAGSADGALMPAQVAAPGPTRGADSGDARAAVRGTAALAGFQAVGRLIGAAFMLLATRHLPPDQFGRYSIVTALLVVGGSVADFGTTSVITRQVSRRPDSSEALLASTL